MHTGVDIDQDIGNAALRRADTFITPVK